MYLAQSRTELSSAPPDPSDCVSWLEYRVVQACQRVGALESSERPHRSQLQLVRLISRLFEELGGPRLSWLRLKEKASLMGEKMVVGREGVVSRRKWATRLSGPLAYQIRYLFS